MMLCALAAALLSAQGTDRPKRPFADLVAEYERAIDGMPGLTCEGSFLKTPHDGRTPGTGTIQVTIWLLDSEETPRGVMVREHERPGEPDEVHITTKVVSEQVTQVFHEEELAYVLDLSRARNTPWMWYFLAGPTSELAQRFGVEVIRCPVREGDPERPASGERPSVAADEGVSPGREARASLMDPYAENAWVIALTPREAALRDEIRACSIWLDKDSLMPYRLEILTAVEDLTVSLSPFRKIDRYPEESFRLSIEGLDVRRR